MRAKSDELVEELVSTCVAFGRGFHYSVTDRLLERIIELYNQRAEVVR